MEAKLPPKSLDRFDALAHDRPPERPGVHCLATKDHAVVRKWATQHSAVPATGEATPSGPAVRVVNDGGAGVRFNFPGFAPYRPISWHEWFENFDRHELLFVYEEEDPQQVAERAHERWQARGREPGREQEDWFEAERDLLRNAGGGLPSVRYRFVKDTGPR